MGFIMSKLSTTISIINSISHGYIIQVLLNRKSSMTTTIHQCLMKTITLDILSSIITLHSMSMTMLKNPIQHMKKKNTDSTTHTSICSSPLDYMKHMSSWIIITRIMTYLILLRSITKNSHYIIMMTMIDSGTRETTQRCYTGQDLISNRRTTTVSSVSILSR